MQQVSMSGPELKRPGNVFPVIRKPLSLNPNPTSGGQGIHRLLIVNGPGQNVLSTAIKKCLAGEPMTPADHSFETGCRPSKFAQVIGGDKTIAGAGPGYRYPNDLIQGIRPTTAR